MISHSGGDAQVTCTDGDSLHPHVDGGDSHVADDQSADVADDQASADAHVADAQASDVAVLEYATCDVSLSI